MKLLKTFVIAAAVYVTSLTGIKADLNGCPLCATVGDGYDGVNQCTLTYIPPELKCKYSGNDFACLLAPLPPTLIDVKVHFDFTSPESEVGGEYWEENRQCYTDDTMCGVNG